MNIDFCTTGLLRPDVLYRTYKSFRENLIDINLKDCRLFLNIDPLPSPQFLDGHKWPYSADDCISVAFNFFGKVVSRTPDVPSHSSAIMWLWDNAETEFIFLLEDDWELLCPIQISQILKNNFKTKPCLQQARFRFKSLNYKPASFKVAKYGLSPSIANKKFYKHFLNKLQSVKKKSFMPERHIRSCSTPSNKRIMYYPNYQVVKDIGYKWKRENNFGLVRIREKGTWTTIKKRVK